MSGKQTSRQQKSIDIRHAYSALRPYVKRSVLMGAAAVFLTSCSTFEPDYIACPSVKALQGAENVITTGADTGNRIIARFDGVNPQCIATPDGHDMKLNFALVLKRSNATNLNVERIPVDITLAYLDKDDQVVSRSVKQVTGYIPGLAPNSRPIFTIDDEIPAGTRVVIGIGKAE